MGFRHFIGVVVVAVLMVGCSSPPPPIQVLPDLRFTDKPPFSLDVARIEVVSAYKAPFKEPNIEHLMPVPPERAAMNWANDRLKAVGRANTARFIVRDASVVEKSLKVDEGVSGLFKKEQSERYEGRLEVVLEIRDEHGRVVGEASASAWRSRTVPEDITIAQREKMWYELTQALAGDMNTLLETNMRQYIARFLVL
ncbi:MAG: hypothetical protein H7840_11355 [Alphaproteobacteria bacterium]